MSSGFVIIVAVLALAQLTLPRRLGFVPLIIASAHLGNVEVLPELTTIRLLLIIGLSRAIAGHFVVWPTRTSSLDSCFVAFSLFAIISTIGHKPDYWTTSPLSARAGLVLNVAGTYLYSRAYLPDIESFNRYATALMIVMVPLAVFMINEKRTRHNFYVSVGAARAEAVVRNDKVRAQGPFRHPILAGTAGATSLPFAFLLWHSGRKRIALVGGAACLGTVMACASSGPVAALAISLAAIVSWYWRQLIPCFVWGGLAVATFYSLIKLRGPWHLMSSMDLVGGSTGYHRATLIDKGFRYFNEWWLFGSDYTRHWMATGVSWNPNHTDITNYYLHLGVIGGAALPLCLFAMISITLSSIASIIKSKSALDPSYYITLWTMNASILAHATSFVSISYFDQMYVLFYLLIGAVPGVVKSAASISPKTQIIVNGQEI